MSVTIEGGFLPSLITFDLVELLSDRVSVTICIVPNLASQCWRQAFDPQFSQSLGSLYLIPIRQELSLPYFQCLC